MVVEGTITNVGSTANKVKPYKVTRDSDSKDVTDHFSITTADGTLTITARAITVTADDQTKVYGEADPELTYTVTSGSLVEGDAFTGELEREAGENVGDYAITQGTLALSSNYELTFVPGTLTITPATGAELVIEDYEGMYDGDWHSISVRKLNEEGNEIWYSEDPENAKSWSQWKPEYRNVGEYTVYVKVVNPNYVERTGSGTVKITKRPLEITAGSATKYYDGKPLTKDSYAITSGSLAEGDMLVDVTVTGSRTEVGSSDNVPSDAVILFDGIEVMDNYDITYVNGKLTVLAPYVPPEEPEDDDEDIPDDFPPLLNLADHFAYIQGYPDNTVRPEGLITREEVAAVFFRLLDPDYREIIRAIEANFPDVLAERWSSKHIATLAKGRILEGYPDGTFKPDNYITRAELAAMASRFDELDFLDENMFSDVEGHWAEKYINSAAAKGWVEGYPDGTFKPDAYITRAEFVTLVNRVLQRRVRAENILPDAKQFPDLLPGTWYYEAMQEAINSHLYERKEDGYEVWLEINFPVIEM